jgi:hypothetical protein
LSCFSLYVQYSLSFDVLKEVIRLIQFEDISLSTTYSERTLCYRRAVTATSESLSHLNTISKTEAFLLTYPEQITTHSNCLNPISETKPCIDIGDFIRGLKSKIASKVLIVFPLITRRYETEMVIYTYMYISILAHTIYMLTHILRDI